MAAATTKAMRHLTANDAEGGWQARCRRWLWVAVCLLLAWSVWARAGTRPSLQLPLPVLGGVILVLTFLHVILSVRQEHCPGRMATAGMCFNPVVLAGGAFLVFLVLQWWNSGRHPYFHPFDRCWVFTQPPHPGWPWSVNRAEAAEMLRWFFSAWSLMMVFHCCRRSVLLAHSVAGFLVINAAVLSLFGIVQFCSGTAHIFWVTYLPVHFFASFGYENHAASYFCLHFGLAAGMLLQVLYANRVESAGTGNPAVLAHGSRLPRLPVAVLAVCALLSLVGAVLSLSRAGIAFALALTVFSLIWAGCVLWPLLSISQRYSSVIVSLMCAMLVLLTTATIGGRSFRREVVSLVQADLTGVLQTRLVMAEAAVTIWRESPWFGTGGWGYRHFLPVYGLDKGITMRSGYANVHNDALQFLCEFGVVGFGLLLMALIAYLRPLFSCVRTYSRSGIMPVVAGLGAVLAHSLIDLPFRSPGIMYAWLAVCGIAPAIFANGYARGSVEPRARNSDR